MPPTKTTPRERCCLVVIDGWGISPNVSDVRGDAIRNAQTPVMNQLTSNYPSMSVAAHGLAVGLPEGLMGNSEVGHLNVGAGRVVYQDIVRIELAIRKRQLAQNPELVEAFARAKAGNGRVHFLGLVSDGGVHSHIRHLKALLEAAKDFGLAQDNVFVHFFGDGRDTAPKSAVGYLRDLLEFLENTRAGRLATITGRYYAMDRDKRWERVQLAYDALTQAKGESVSVDKVVEAVEKRYAAGETDEFLKPMVVEARGAIGDGDTLVLFNYRSDRMRQLAQTLGKVGGSHPFPVELERTNLHILSMTQYKSDFPFPVLFPQQTMDNVLAEWLGKLEIPQMHIAETEKYAHVTFFFNGGTEAQFPLEERQMIPSPKVATYDLKPEMSAKEVGDAVAAAIRTQKYPFVMCNFAPPDMVGHTGVYEAAMRGVEATDAAIGVIYEECKRQGYILFVTSDHGNAEKMLSDDFTSPHTAHTTARVPFLMTSDSKTYAFRKDLITDMPAGSEGDTLEMTGGALCDVAPTILEVMGLPIPKEMTGQSLLQH